MGSNIHDLLELFQFWFSNESNWFNSNQEFDNLIKLRFSNLVEKYNIDISGYIQSIISTKESWEQWKYKRGFNINNILINPNNFIKD